MATNLQVNAVTSSAVGAFNALAASIQAARGQFALLGTATNVASSAANRAASSYSSVNGAFTRLTSSLNSVYTLMRNISGAMQFVFGALLRELDKLQGFQAIMSVTTKSSEEAGRSYDFLRGTANQLGVQIDALTSNYAKLVAALPEGEAGIKLAQNAFLGLARAARTLHASNSDTQLMFYAVTQMASKGVVSMEELRRQLGEKLPGVMQIAAKALNTTPELLEAAIRKGTVNSIKFLQYFADELNRTFKEPAEKAAQSVDAAFNRLKNVWVDFVKQVLDSGAGQSIVNLFDAIREKLSDPYVMQQFASLVKSIADRLTEMVKGISAADIRSGFDTFYKIVQAGITVLQKFVGLMEWIINNGAVAGAVVGGIAGLQVGAALGPQGALAGAVIGAAGGAYGGSKVTTPTAGEVNSRKAADAATRAATLAQYGLEAQKRQELELFKMNQLIPTLQNFRALNSLSGLDNLMKAENLNTTTIENLTKILKDPKLGSDQARVDALRKYNDSLALSAKSAATLSDVLTSGSKGKKDPQAGALNSTAFRAAGFDANFGKEYQNLRKLLDMGRLTEAQYNQAVDKLLAKQPVIIDSMKEQHKQQEALNKATSDYITFILKKTEFADAFEGGIQDEYNMAKLRNEEAQIESRLLQAINTYKEHGLDVSKQQVEAWREQYTIIAETVRISQIASGMWDSTVNRNRPRDDEVKAMQRNLADPSGQFTKRDGADYLVGKYKSDMEGTAEYYDLQRRMLEDWYTTVDQWRALDVISEQTAQQLKLKAATQYQAMYLEQASGFFNNIAVLSQSSNKRVAAIGKAAAIAEATIQGYLAIQRALASAPPPFNFILAAGVAVKTGANIAAIRSQGYMSGGYTGDGPVNQVAGPVHRREYVFDAASVRRIGVRNLEAIRSGTAAARSASSTPSAPAQASSKDGLRIINVLDPAIVGDYLASPEGDMVIVNAIRRNKDSIDNL